jgi:hypothetical protein
MLRNSVNVCHASRVSCAHVAQIMRTCPRTTVQAGSHTPGQKSNPADHPVQPSVQLQDAMMWLLVCICSLLLLCAVSAAEGSIKNGDILRRIHLQTNIVKVRCCIAAPLAAWVAVCLNMPLLLCFAGHNQIHALRS